MADLKNTYQIKIDPPSYLSELPIEQPISTQSHITFMSYDDYKKELDSMRHEDKYIMNFFKSFSNLEEEKHVE